MLANFDKHRIKPFFRTMASRLFLGGGAFWLLSLDVFNFSLHSNLCSLLQNARHRTVVMILNLYTCISFCFVLFCFVFMKLWNSSNSQKCIYLIFSTLYLCDFKNTMFQINQLVFFIAEQVKINIFSSLRLW